MKTVVIIIRLIKQAYVNLGLIKIRVFVYPLKNPTLSTSFPAGQVENTLCESIIINQGFTGFCQLAAYSAFSINSLTKVKIPGPARPGQACSQFTL